MEAAHATNGLMTRAQIKMISVAEDDFGAERFEDVLRDGLDRSRSADWHEDRRLDSGMRQMEAATTATGGGLGDELKRWSHGIILSGNKG
jgi:hypothetical protein